MRNGQFAWVSLGFHVDFGGIYPWFQCFFLWVSGYNPWKRVSVSTRLGVWDKVRDKVRDRGQC